MVMISSAEIAAFSRQFSILVRNYTNERGRGDSVRTDAQGARIIGRREAIPRGGTTSSSSAREKIASPRVAVMFVETRHDVYCRNTDHVLRIARRRLFLPRAPFCSSLRHAKGAKRSYERRAYAIKIVSGR